MEDKELIQIVKGMKKVLIKVTVAYVVVITGQVICDFYNVNIFFIGFTCGIICTVFSQIVDYYYATKRL